MKCVDVLDNGIMINGHLFLFPLSYAEIKAVLGDARIFEYHREHFAYFYDDMGLSFEGSPYYLTNLKKKKAFVDNDHIIIGLTLHVTGNKVFRFIDSVSANKYRGNLTSFGKQIDPDSMYSTMSGYRYSPVYMSDLGKEVHGHVNAMVYVKDYDPRNGGRKFDGQLYEGDNLLQDVHLTFEPERPKSHENYNIVQPEEACLHFDTFNFKLAVINELMYNQEVLKPYFDIYDYMVFKKAHWNLETDKNVRAAVNFFKELPIPARLADMVTEICMDGSDEIYMHIAPEWDGRDERFDFCKLTESEVKQFKNLKKMQILGNSRDAAVLRKICAPLGIDVEPLAETDLHNRK